MLCSRGRFFVAGGSDLSLGRTIREEVIEAEVLFKSVTKASQDSITAKDPKKLTEAAA